MTCKSLNREFLNRVQNENGIFDSEADETLRNFHRSAQYHPRFDYGNSWYNLDKFLLGNTNWNGVSTELLREDVQRSLIWALQLNDVQKKLRWTAREWG